MGRAKKIVTNQGQAPAATPPSNEPQLRAQLQAVQDEIQRIHSLAAVRI